MLSNFGHCCYVFHWFKWKEYNKLPEICFPNMQWAENMLHAIYLQNMFHTICFIRVRRALRTGKAIYGDATKAHVFCCSLLVKWVWTNYCMLITAWDTPVWREAVLPTPPKKGKTEFNKMTFNQAEHSSSNLEATPFQWPFSKYHPSLVRHSVTCWTHFSSIVLANSFGGMRLKICHTSCTTSTSDWKNHTHNPHLRIRNSQMSQGARQCQNFMA